MLVPGDVNQQQEIMLHGKITSVGQPGDIAPELEAAYLGAG